MAQLEYWPDQKAFATHAVKRSIRSLLVIGSTVPSPQPTRTRMLASTHHLPSGVYFFAVEDGHWDVMCVQSGGTPGPLASADWNAGDDDPLVNAYGWFEKLFGEAEDVPTPQFSVGQAVIVKSTGADAHVHSQHLVDGQWMYRIASGGSMQNVAEDALVANDMDGDPQVWISRPPADVSDFAAAVTRKKLVSRLSDTVYAFKASRTLFRAYQYRPVMRFLESATSRLLIADEVGLGKTIEAGIVWLELEARQQAGRVLVVVPSALVPKWCSEMKERFGFDLAVHKRSELDDLLKSLETDSLPPRFHAVVSLETLRSWRGLERLAALDPRFDLVIVDEAHQMRNSNTASNTVGALLSDWADSLLFLTATPLNLGNRDLFNLLQLLQPLEFDDPQIFVQRLGPNRILNSAARSLVEHRGDTSEALRIIEGLADDNFGKALMINPLFGDLVQLLRQGQLGTEGMVAARELIKGLNVLSSYLTRTRKSEVEDGKAVREPLKIEVNWTEKERDFYLHFEKWQHEAAAARQFPTGFATQMPMRLASSCLPVARQKVLERSSFGPADDDLNETTDSADVSGATPSKELEELARSLGEVDSKFDAFEKVVEDVVAGGRQALVFTFFKGTLSYLQGRLGSRFRVGVLHGDMDSHSRHQIMRGFRQGEYDLVIATKVASEGLDFEFCSTVINYDLPWNPMEVEQRIGRIDRFGQKSEIIYVVNFHIAGTLESEIIERIHSRIGVFRDSIGELEAIIAERLSDLSKVVFDFSLSLEQKIKKADQILEAIETQRIADQQLADAADQIAALDQADIAGMESAITSAGRFVGPGELVNFLRSWIERYSGASLKESPDGTWLHIDGTDEMCDDLERLAHSGERLRSEISRFVRNFKDRMTVMVATTQEAARRTGEDMLTVNHPLVRAAVSSELGKGVRFTHCAVKSNAVASGTYNVLLGLVKWTGVRESAELWATSVLASDGTVVPEAGQLLLNAIAEGILEPGGYGSIPDITLLELEAMRRQMAEEGRRQDQNRAIVESRRTSIIESFERKRETIKKRIETARANDNHHAVRLQESQLRTQDLRESLALQKLDAQRKGSLSVEPFAVCVMRVN